MNNTNIEDPVLNYILNELKEMLLKDSDITEEDLLYFLECQKEVYKPIPFIQKFFSNNYKLIKIYYRFITSCNNETYYLLYNEENKDIVLIKDPHSCFGSKTIPHISKIEKIYELLDDTNKKIELYKIKNYETDMNKKYYSSKEHYESVINQSLMMSEYELIKIQEFINDYLELPQ